MKRYDIPLYRGKFIVILTNSMDKLKGTLGDDYISGELFAHALYVGYKGYQSFVTVFNFDNENMHINHGLITHEVIHCLSYILDSRGIKADLNNDEPVAYLSEWLTNRIYEFIHEKGFKVRYE